MRYTGSPQGLAEEINKHFHLRRYSLTESGNYRYELVGGGIVNFWHSTGAVNFQGHLFRLQPGECFNRHQLEQDWDPVKILTDVRDKIQDEDDFPF